MSQSLAMNYNTNVGEMKNYIQKELDSFLESKSPNTAKNYRGDLNQFFKYMFDKESKFVTREELVTITGLRLVEYKNELSKKQKGTTVNRKIKSARSFFKYLEADHKEIRSAVFNKVEKAKEHDKKGWGELTLDEVNNMVEHVKHHPDGYEMSILFEVAFITAIRLDALLTATYEDNIFLRNEDGENIWTIEVIDKDQTHVKSISNELKQKIDTLNRKPNEKIFKSLHDHKVGDAIRSLVVEMGIDQRRNIRFHSFKKASINYVLDMTGDIKQAQLQGNHKSAKTTLDSYVKRNTKLSAQPSYYMGRDVDTTPIHELSHEELLAIIENSSVSLKSELLRNIK